MEQDNIISRIEDFLELDLSSVNSFAKQIGVDPGNMRKMLAGKQNITDKTLRKISDACGVSFEWLKHGKGEMFDKEESTEANRTGKIPLLDLDAAAGFSLVDATDGGDRRMLSLPHCDGAINVRGHSMEPEIHDGDIAAFVMLPSAASIRPDGVYIVQYIDEDGFTHITIKRAKCSPRGSHYIRLASVNEEYGFEDIPLSAISRAAKVRFTLSLLSY